MISAGKISASSRNGKTTKMNNSINAGLPETQPCRGSDIAAPRQLYKPIFIVGHARGGSTLFARILNQHSQVESNFTGEENFDVNDQLKRLLDLKLHSEYGEAVEQKNVWFDFFPGESVFSHMGRELIVEQLNLTAQERNRLISRLTANLSGLRFLSKSPSNSFRVKILPLLFPGAKIVAIYRQGPEVVTSWGQRAYGFGKRVSNNELKCRKLGYRQGINIFAKKWYETVSYLEAARAEMGFLAITYDDLIDHTSATLETVFDYLELPIEDYIYNIKLDDRRSGWKEKIPWWHHKYLLKCTARGLELYRNAQLFQP